MYVQKWWSGLLNLAQRLIELGHTVAVIDIVLMPAVMPEQGERWLLKGVL